MLRGYKLGQYKGKSMSSIEAEERLRLGDRFTASFFAGVAGLYGDGRELGDGENLFPALGGGVQYLLKPKAGIVLSLEYAVGKDGNYGVYLKIGYSPMLYDEDMLERWRAVCQQLRWPFTPEQW